MITDILKDIILKLRQADKIQQRYKRYVTFKLGLVAAGIMETYISMLELYKKYTEPKLVTDQSVNVERFFTAYHIIKTDYNEIRHEYIMFYEILENHLKQQEAKAKTKSLLNLYKKKQAQRSDILNVTSPGAEEFKRSLRYKKWAEKWNNFVPEIEGVDVDIDNIKI
ncbi:uncharacterized protein LOC116412807 [Galleria mellonella]|uniref:Uncharacterized protein LOC116412807 n=1 Tax=Galleria mellonella TaxID=7137 RepID=A0ABM3M9P8_GALME|nr:uncharacterized protein LOC116412807 [Galleria mellonella]